MNKIKLYKKNAEGEVETKVVKITQSTNHDRGTKRTLPWAQEVYKWAHRFGWSRKKPKPSPLPSKIS